MTAELLTPVELLEGVSTGAVTPRVTVLESRSSTAWPSEFATPARHLPVPEMLTRAFTSDVHFLQYTVPDLPYRVLKGSVAELPSPMEVSLIAFDVDDPVAHSSASGHSHDDWFFSERRKLELLLKAHPGGFVYRSRRGYRLLYTLPGGMHVRSAEQGAAWELKYVRSAIYLLRTFEIVADVRCKSLWQPFRAPHATRSGNTPEDLDTLGDPHNVGAWDYEPSDGLQAELEFVASIQKEHAGWNSARSTLERVVNPAKPRRARVATQRMLASAPDVPTLESTAFASLVSDLAVEVAQIPDGKHGVYMAIAGALLGKGVSDAELIAIVAEVATRCRDPKAQKRIADARSSIRRFRAGEDTTGLTTLRREWARVAMVIARQFPTTDAIPLIQHGGDASEELLPLTESTAKIVDLVRRLAESSEPRLEVLKVPMGTGKTTIALETLLRANTKVAVAHPTNRVAVEQFARLQLFDPSAVARRFGVLALIDERGKPVCRMASTVEILQPSGVPVPQKICVRCVHRENCRAVAGVEGPGNARILLGTHALTKVLADHVEKGGVLVLDEMPPLTTHAEISPTELREAASCLAAVFPAAITRIAELVLHLLAAGGAFQTSNVLNAIEQAVAGWGEGEVKQRLIEAHMFAHGTDDALDASDAPEPLEVNTEGTLGQQVVALFVATLARWPHHRVPPMNSHTARALATGRNDDLARRVAMASRTLALLQRALNPANELKMIAYRENGGLAVTLPNEALVDALTRCRKVLVLDASASRGAIQRIASSRATLHAWTIPDGAPVRRILLLAAQGAKSRLLSRFGVRWSLLLALVVDALNHCPEGATILLVTHKVCAEELKRRLSGRLDRSRAELALAEWVKLGRLVVTHFGALRGRNEFDGIGWADLDGVVTVGDPWPDVGVVGDERDALALDEETRDSWNIVHVQQELAQAQGRLRTVRQSKPTVAIHVGRIMPAGWHSLATVIERPVGRRATPPSIDPEELGKLVASLGTVSEVSKRIGCSERSLRAYLKGERAMPRQALERLNSECQNESSAQKPELSPSAVAGLTGE